MSYADYESWGQLNLSQRSPLLLETYGGAEIVLWHGKIERQINNLVADAEKGRNFSYADKLREMLRIWRENEITGSINRETLDTLKAACDVLAVDSWNLNSYFSSLRDQLRALVASEEELPRGMDMNQNDPMAGLSSGGGGAPPMMNDFGPTDEAPGDMGGEPGAEGDLGGPGGAPGGEDMGAEGEVPPGGEPGAEGEPPPGGEEGLPPVPGEEPEPEDENTPDQLGKI